MHIILTHEQADFDAVAALLGASLINESAIPVLPRRLNRNVRAFINLYQTELPFVEVQYLPPGRIDTITLVDTQSLVTIKGMVDDPTIHVIDHHDIREDTPAAWIIAHEKVGACTTLFVDSLSEQNGFLNMVPATLLLLGIYEDTGSLTYAGTTAKDIRAAAFLIDHGASLRIAGDYLNPPLSGDQRILYDRLLKSTSSYAIHGKNIVIGCASARDMDEEISSVAHKIRDLLELDALFVLVETLEGIRLVARSTTDQINVANVAGYFGGGGHERAAAALINPESFPSENKPLEQVCKKLVEILPDFVTPSITVKEIMSPHPLVLSTDTAADEAARLMQRYGYEGYPVIKQGSVVGLLNRRAVDRATAHKLNLPVASLMEAGNVFVKPGDSLDHLQHVMSSSGWGQIPVIDPVSGEIVGIVTRTDLIRIMSNSESTVPGKYNIASRLENALPPDRLSLLKLIAENAHTHHLPVYLVGGFVRDILMDRPGTDFDIVVEGDGIRLAKALSKLYGGRVVSHKRFGTAKWKIQGIHQELGKHLGIQSGDPLDLPSSLDFTSSRTEFYDYPTALPTVERGSIKLDLHRRDFSINTIAVRLDGRHFGDLYDHWGGLNDIKKGVIRVLHSLSFVDDPTRMLRAVRFEQRFGFRIEERSLELIIEAKELLKQLSGERIRNEFTLILNEEKSISMLDRVNQLGLFEHISADLFWNSTLSGLIKNALDESADEEWELPDELGNLPLRHAILYLIWLSNLTIEKAGAVSRRLCFSHHLEDTLKDVITLRQEIPELVSSKPSIIVNRLDRVPTIGLYSVYLQHLSMEIDRILLKYVKEWRHVQPLITGNDLKAMKIKPGPSYGNILRTLRDSWLDGIIHNKLDENALLEQILLTLGEHNQDRKSG